jgi:hypothetical protein
MAKESGIAKSIGDQKEDDMEGGNHRLCDYLRTGAKVQKMRLTIENNKVIKINKGIVSSPVINASLICLPNKSVTS